MATATHTTNGQANGNGTPQAKGKGKGKAKGGTKRRAGKVNQQQRLALLVGGVGAFVLLLSVWECCQALHSLTGMPYVLAGLLAIGIDLGMAATEMAAVVSAKGSDAHRWAERYIGLAVGLSVVLNAAAAAAHAEGWMKLAAVAVGGVVPLLVYIAGRVAGGLWTGK